ncbi:MAG: GTP 3',8-cyclase MoaA [Opitutae bacterium]|jgi:GTP 3',8-cyclase|nr:GTP 3',8-cyclase MoaA [Opitutae bacterium]MBT4225682.1 GTP 3',8-cyclase MoaA [Opitutae bacterium]MBT5690318.1 GTP 3',8-cyclase MoaA [Opitutae bacterium]MBT6462505.1 GTP 3',8-cyclase MoaA [Opitutae bacterium]MBT7852344.1 GTP 3',8-cyclase MoaA [Opitutae bacterium]
MKTLNDLTTSNPRDQLGRNLRDLRVSLTDQCNLRCGYCMPNETFGPDYTFLNKEKILSFVEIRKVVEAFAACGGKKVRLTGGEPLLRPNVEDLVQDLRTVDGIEEIALTTNGLLLRKNAKRLKAAGLDRVTLSLDAIEDETFRKMSGKEIPVEKVIDGIRSAEEAKLAVKVNSVIIKGINDHQVLPLAEYFRGTPHILRFIEYMDVGNCNNWSRDNVYTTKEILADVQSRYQVEPVEANYVGEVARRYRYLDGQGEFGMIGSVSQPFCKDCNRARLSADGILFTCLFASTGKNLREVLRGNGDIRHFLEGIWRSRDDRYSELRSDMKVGKVEMSYIGG